MPSKRHLMILGTGSGAGKSLLVSAICRYLARQGLSVAPFKAQNMALNAFVTEDNAEIAMAQAFQAEASLIPPHADMNPVLLKSSGAKGIQVILNGKVYGSMTAKEYYAFRDTAWQAVTEAFDRLRSRYEHIVIEGAGSPAEINLQSVDIANMQVAKYANANCLLVADIDKGGVFASLYGTMKLLKRQARQIKGFVINKFRGDIDILTPGYKMLKDLTGRSVIGTIPFISNIRLPQEDSMFFGSLDVLPAKAHAEIKAVIVKVPRIANFTDFDPLFVEPDVSIKYTLNPLEIETADLVILPGTKNTTDDLQFLYDHKLHTSIAKASKRGAIVFGLCGGYQMLGTALHDPNLTEGTHKHLQGLSLLDIETEFKPYKTTRAVKARMQGLDNLSGFEIHMGQSQGELNLFEITTNDGQTLPEGTIKDNCIGTYLHGIFENDSFRRLVINLARKAKGLKEWHSDINYRELKHQSIEQFTDFVSAHLDMDFVQKLLFKGT